MLKPLIDGNGIMKLYEIKGGRGMRGLLEEQIKWQILNPDAKREEAEKFLLDNKAVFVEKHKL